MVKCSYTFKVVIIIGEFLDRNRCRADTEKQSE